MPLLLRLATWATFLACAVFAYFALKLPFAYHFLRAQYEHPHELLIGWFWTAVLGLLPSVILIALVFAQRRIASRRQCLLWLAPAFLLLASAIYWVALAALK